MKKFPSLVIIRCIKLIGVGEGRGSQGETGDDIGMISSPSHAAPGAHRSQMLTFISGCLWSTGLYYSCFTREENGSREGMGFIHFLSQGHIKRGSGPLELFREESPTLPHSCPTGSPENKTQSMALSKPLPESVSS